MGSLYQGHQGLARYADQQVLYQWPKFEQKASLPHGAFLGQEDPRANGDCWIICKAGADGLSTGKFFRAPPVITFDNDLSKAYTSGQYALYLKNHAVNPIAITADAYAEALISIYSQTSGTDHAGLTNRVMGNTAVAATADAEFKIELEYPWEEDIEVGINTKIAPLEYNGVLKMDATADQHAVGWCPIDVTANYYFWGKIEGTILCQANGVIAVGDALSVLGDSDADEDGRVTKSAVGEQIVASARDSGTAGQWLNATLQLG